MIKEDYNQSVTVGQFIAKCFRADHQNQEASEEDGLTEQIVGALKCPIFPPDMFGVCGVLLHNSGAYSMFSMTPEFFGKKFSNYILSNKDVNDAKRIGRIWGEMPSLSEDMLPKGVISLWNSLVSYRNERLFQIPKTEENEKVPGWWKVAHQLLIVADEACFGIGRFGNKADELVAGQTISWVDAEIRNEEFSEMVSNGQTDRDLTRLRPTKASLAKNLCRDIACVQPKSMTTQVGCTMRALSQNLALLPPRGQIRAHWMHPTAPSLGETSTVGLNILAIPFPYDIPNSSFQVSPKRTKQSAWFKISQDWLPRNDNEKRAFIQFIRAIIDQALTKGKVHALIFPELSLNWSIFEEITRIIQTDKKYESVQFIVAGSIDNCNGDVGNFALNANFYLEKDGSKQKRSVIVTSRPKHHRWKIDEWQQDTYDLKEPFSGTRSAWEFIPIPQREVHTSVFREGNVYTTLICEDLARSEPCHDTVRSIGPNLVFVLLMDGSQRLDRWSARYATGLSDDPGSAVLTLTSRALVKRANNVIKRSNEEKKRKLQEGLIEELSDLMDEDWSVALWKDETTRGEPIDCPDGTHALFIRLNADRRSEDTSDGRESDAGSQWKMSGQDLVSKISVPDPQLCEIEKTWKIAY